MTIKRFLPLVAGLNLLAVAGAFADGLPAGRLIELHSCEVYAGGCTVSSEAQQGGRLMFQVWDLAHGSWQGVDLAGLKVAVLASSADNLADQGTRPDSTVVYLPKGASAAQQKALLGWLKSQDGQLAASSIQTRVAPITLTSSVEGVKVQVGKYATVQAASLGACENRVCGEDLWYDPSVSTSRFTVALDETSQVREPLLQLKWDDHAKRSVFLAAFGDKGNGRNVFVHSSEWCGAAGRLY